MSSTNIHVHHVTRIEGHADIDVILSDGRIEKVLWSVTESPRLFEVMLRGRDYGDVAHVASRICGICSIAHSLASIRATEKAFGIEVSRQSEKLRSLLFHAEVLESHILHAYFLAAPDFLGVDSAVSLASSDEDALRRAMRLKRLAYVLAEELAGRKTHPISCVVGGFAKLPDPRRLEAVLTALRDSLADLERTVDLFASLEMPDFARETEYIALTDPHEYAFLSNTVASSDTGSSPIEAFVEEIEEFCVPHSTAKYARHRRPSYMVGALSRFNLSHDRLRTRAKDAAERLGLVAPCHNPHANTSAQVVECMHAAEESISILEELLGAPLSSPRVEVVPRAGRGIGVVEAPRGLLIHDYTYEASGAIASANCIIPTNQNHGNIQADMEALLPSLVDPSEDEIRHRLEVLVRAYDPCVSCSTHALRVRVGRTEARGARP
ncbi:MAG: Ni/Fe hydrogenase subunit alpha [Candidatus Bipolaricaulota bacterium]|nr:MAG: Ni/Fe hydrogenase subunit alpha [Candidatus Bipolaricaulota bacterium]